MSSLKYKKMHYVGKWLKRLKICFILEIDICPALSTVKLY